MQSIKVHISWLVLSPSENGNSSAPAVNSTELLSSSQSILPSPHAFMEAGDEQRQRSSTSQDEEVVGEEDSQIFNVEPI